MNEVKKLHWPVEIMAVTESYCVNEECHHEEGGCPKTIVGLCGECARIAEEADPYFADYRIDYVLFPRRTWEAAEDL